MLSLVCGKIANQGEALTPQSCDQCRSQHCVWVLRTSLLWSQSVSGARSSNKGDTRTSSCETIHGKGCWWQPGDFCSTVAKGIVHYHSSFQHQSVLCTLTKLHKQHQFLTVRYLTRRCAHIGLNSEWCPQASYKTGLHHSQWQLKLGHKLGKGRCVSLLVRWEHWWAVTDSKRCLRAAKQSIQDCKASAIDARLTKLKSVVCLLYCTCSCKSSFLVDSEIYSAAGKLGIYGCSLPKCNTFLSLTLRSSWFYHSTLQKSVWSFKVSYCRIPKHSLLHYSVVKTDQGLPDLSGW